MSADASSADEAREREAREREARDDIARFATLGCEGTLAGVGLHSGARVCVRLLPRDGVGIAFARVDLPGAPIVEADWTRVSSTQHATVLEHGGARVSTVEHLLAALWSRGVTGCRVELNGPEVPILDGSAQVWCELLNDCGLQPHPVARPIWRLRAPVWVEHENVTVLGLPHNHADLHVSCAVDFGALYRQTVDLRATPSGFEHDLAPARTFAREEWLPALRASGLIRGGALDNALLLGSKGPSSPWRLPDELARHKALDLVGDLALLAAPSGARLGFHLVAVRAGHGLHRAWISEAVRSHALQLDT